MPTFTLTDELREDVDGRPILSPTKFMKRMNLDVNLFAQHAKVHRNTVSRAPAAPSIQVFLRENLRVLSAAMDANGGDLVGAIFWYQNEPLAPFDYKTAETLVTEGRADDVIRLIESYEAGFAG